MKKIGCALLSLMLVLICLLGCSSLGEPMMTLGDTEMTANTVSLFLSRYKGVLSMSEPTSLYDFYWDTIVDNQSGKTNNDIHTEYGLSMAKTYLAAAHVFEERGLSLSDATEDAVEAKIDGLIEDKGSKSKLNEELSQYGANVDILREAYLLEEKMEMLMDDLYGEDGSLIGKNEKDDYYTENYRRFRQIFIPLYEFVYETDEKGNTVQKTDENGKYVIRELTETEMASVEERIETIQKTIKDGDYVGFDELVERFDEEPNESSKTYSGGFYLSPDSPYEVAEVKEALFGMNEGEYRTVIPSGGYGIYIVMRYENEESGYAKEENKDFFNTFTVDLKNHLVEEYLERYKAQIDVDTSVAEGVDMKSVGANLYY
ncbi:MAG: peptidylprolyl isomerase [Clostridia bacterium]|nr:peptidylprolyl isomerase [Clostridia bacterium]